MNIKENESPQSININEIIKSFKSDFQEIYLGSVNNIKPIYLSAQNAVQNYLSEDDFKRKFSMNFLKEITLMLKNEELRHRDFFLEVMRENEFWQPLIKLILVKRIEELKKCKVIKKGRKYDISDLKATYLGKFIIDKFEFTRRSMLNDQEYNKLINTIKKLKYEVPVVILPTETEKFFEN